MKPSRFCFSLVLYISIQLVQSSENSPNNLGDVIKNRTKTVYNSTRNQNEEESLLKKETRKFLQECGVETGDNSYDNNHKRSSANSRRGTNGRRNSSKGYGSNGGNSDENDDYRNSYNSDRNRGNFHSSYGNDDDNWNNSNRYGNRLNRNRYNKNCRGNNKRYNENCSDEEDGSDEYSQTSYYGYSNNNNNNNNNNGRRGYNLTSSSNRGYYYNGYGSAHNGYAQNGYNNNNNYCRDENRGYYNGNGYGYNRYGNGGNMRRALSEPGTFGANLRERRSNSNDDNSQCVSQCVFGYLEVLDDNRVPSETLVIKWLQDRLSNDMKRIRALREARRCFARLSTTADTEDGCEFSQALSKCLNLELEDKTT